MQIQEDMFMSKAAHLWVFSSILAHLAQFFFLILDATNEYYSHIFKQAAKRKHVSEQSCSSVRVFLLI